MGSNFIRDDLHPSQSNDFAQISDEENRWFRGEGQSFLVALGFEQEAAERLRRLNKLTKDMRLRINYSLNVLKSNSRSFMRMRGQLQQDLQNIQQECEAFQNFIGKTLEEMCAVRQIFDKFINFIRESKKGISELAGYAESLFMDLSNVELMGSN